MWTIKVYESKQSMEMNPWKPLMQSHYMTQGNALAVAEDAKNKGYWAEVFNPQQELVLDNNTYWRIL